MNLRRLWVLFLKEAVQGPKNYIFIMALVMPLAFTLLVQLVFGSYFSGQPRLGITDQGGSRLPALAQENSALIVRTYGGEQALREAVERGSVDIGLALPAGFDQQVQANEPARLTVFVWGESHMRSRIIVSTAVVQMVRQVAGHEAPVEIVEAVLGTGVNVPWEKRLLPLMVLMTIMLSGLVVPATLIVSEKTRRTLGALAVTPASLMEIFAAKGLMGALLGIVTALLILFLNGAFGGQPLLLLSVLLLATIFASSLGMIMGAVIKDINTLFTSIKSVGIFLYAPGFIQMFPEFPQWIGRVFPTYYALQPVLDISLENAGLADIWQNVAILVGLTLLALAVLAGLARKMQEAEALA